MNGDRVYIQHILDAIEKIERYVEGVSLTSLTEDEMRVDAVVRELEIIGEASNNLTEDFRAAHQDVPWQQVRGMRNRIVHEYFGVDIAVVWQTTQDDLPKLKELLKRLV